MSRFTELKRIESAIENGDRRELEWAVGYCRMRLQAASRKDHRKYWREFERRIRQLLTDSE